jgi:alpha-tubulin suppressor-like RCC1 family protein
MISTTNFIGSDGVDVGFKLLEKEYFNSVYLNIANQYITPELWVWGYGFGGHLGTNVTRDESTPVTTFAGGSNWKQISTGPNHSAAIKTDGTLWTWGENNNAYLGINTTDMKCSPVTTFAGGTNWKQVSLGPFHSAAIKTDGSLWTWGSNGGGRLGINSLVNRSTPVTTFAGGTNWKQVSCGGEHIAATKTDGTLWIWGARDSGELGNNDDLSDRLTPVTTFAGGTNWKQVSLGDGHGAAVKTDGSLWLWGNNSYGKLGTGDNTIDRSTPVTTFAGGNDWNQVSCGVLHTAAIKTDGSLWVWGAGITGRLGINNSTTKFTPVTTFLGGYTWRQVSCGNNFTSAIKTDGSLWVWGNNVFAQLGNRDKVSRSTPITTFAGGNNWKYVSSAGEQTLAIRSYED